MASKKDTPRGNWGKISGSGMGGFLNPPFHPEHSMSVTSIYPNKFAMSLSSAVDCEWLNDETRARAKKYLEAWKPLPLDDPKTRDWIYHVLGYFARCYTIDKSIRDVNNETTFRIVKDDRNEDKSYHLGVLFIQDFYPAYEPNDEDFANAYWGKKNN